MTKLKLIPTLTAVIAVVGAAPASACTNSDSTVSQVGPQAAAEATHCLVNESRAAAGLAPLGPQETLGETAGRYAADMVERHYFSHTPPEGTSLEGKLEAYISPASRWLVGENLAYEVGGRATPRQVVTDWLNSEAHRANLMSPDYRELGVGIVNGTPSGEPGGTFATHFGVREFGSAAPQKLSVKRKRRCGKGRVRVKRNGVVRCRKKRR